MLDLASDFRELERPEGGDGPTRFTATRIEAYPRHRIAKDIYGWPCLLISAGTGRGGPPVVLEHLMLQHNVECRITQPDGALEVARFTVLRCTEGDAALEDYFLRVGGTILALVGHEPTDAQVRLAVDGLVELFRAMQLPSKKATQGFWGELLLIARARDPAQLVRAWHVLPGDRYDFSGGSQRIEVKAAIGHAREHHFALEQVSPVLGTDVLIASILVQRAGAGTSVGDLLSEIRSRVAASAELLLRVDHITVLTLGNGWRSAYDDRFDLEFAQASLAFYDVATVPRPNPLLPQGVSEVRFRADLSRVDHTDLRRFRELGGIFEAAFGP